MLCQLLHNGVIVPPAPEPTGLTISVRGAQRTLSPKQDEMAQAWARKKDTPYVQDPVFCANFLGDFSAELGVEGSLTLDEIDFDAFYRWIDAVKAGKEALSKEERKALAAERRAKREALKAKYGYAIVNGQRVLLGTYMTEPSGIFMGRGEHPLRGRWKEGAAQCDITLNHSPDHPSPEGAWQEIIWQPESLWVARWKDKLSGKLKYIWLGDTAPVKQEREADKFDKAIKLEAKIERVQAAINKGLLSDDATLRRVATACYLIDELCLRVGDEKDPDEADTVGATTLRPEHVTIHDDGRVEFRFLGKDSVEWHKTIRPPQVVRDNLAELIENARPSKASERFDRDLPQLFPDVSSARVNAFFQSIMPGLSAKVFRTHHATQTVKESLASSKVGPKSAEYLKWRAASVANYQAAQLCNHTKQYNGDWQRSKTRYEERAAKAEARIERYTLQVDEYQKKLRSIRAEAKRKLAAVADKPERLATTRVRYDKRIAAAKRRVEGAKGRKQRARDAHGKIKAQLLMAGRKRTWNLGTSLKSYIDPRVYARWGRKVNYDILSKYYPATLRRKFAWVRFADAGLTAKANKIAVRTCMSLDAEQALAFCREVAPRYAEIEIPSSPEQLEHWLPALEQPWRESLIASDKRGRILGLAAVGPTFEADETTYLDLTVLLAEGLGSDAALASKLAMEITRSLQAFETQHPRARVTLGSSAPSWFEEAPQLVYMLSLQPEEEAAEESEA